MSKITESARGEMCQVRLPGVCKWDSSTVVFAHENGGGMSQKEMDLFGAYACSACHDVVDGRVPRPSHIPAHDLQIMWCEAIFRTQRALYFKGLILIKGEKDGRKRKS